MKLNFDFQFKTLKGEVIEGEAGHAASNLATIMWNSNLGGVKFSAWATKLILKPHEIEVSPLDKDVLTEWLNSLNKDPKSNVSIGNGTLDQLIASIESQAKGKK